MWLGSKVAQRSAALDSEIATHWHQNTTSHSPPLHPNSITLPETTFNLSSRPLCSHYYGKSFLVVQSFPGPILNINLPSSLTYTEPFSRDQLQAVPEITNLSVYDCQATAIIQILHRKLGSAYCLECVHSKPSLNTTWYRLGRSDSEEILSRRNNRQEK